MDAIDSFLKALSEEQKLNLLDILNGDIAGDSIQGDIDYFIYRIHKSIDEHKYVN